MARGLKLVQGVGLNDADYPVTQVDKVTGNRFICPYYRKWDSMLTRCYSKSFHRRRPSYEGCTVCEEWLTFSNFKAWMEQQDWEGKELDKDLLVKGNKVYSPETCIFITQLLNSFSIEGSFSKSSLLLGCCSAKNSTRYRSYCSNPLTKKREALGNYPTELEAHNAWKKRKLELVDLLKEAGYIPNEIVYNNLIEKYKGETNEN